MPMQPMEALSKANEVRHARAELKRHIAQGKTSPLEILQEPADYVLGMKVRELLLSVHKLGPNRVDRAMALARISPEKRIGRLTERQVVELDERLSSTGRGPRNPWNVALSPKRGKSRVT